MHDGILVGHSAGGFAAGADFAIAIVVASSMRRR